MVYNHIDCKSPFSKKILPGNSLEWKWNLRSFHICNKEEGGSLLNLDFTEYYNASKATEYPQVIESFRNVISCVTVPTHVQERPQWSINNHGNSLLAYFEPDCSKEQWKPMYIADGIWYESQNIYSYTRSNNVTKKLHKIQSFGPSSNSTYFTNEFINSMVMGSRRDVNKIINDMKNVQSNASLKSDKQFIELEKKFIQFEEKLENLQRGLEDSLEKQNEIIEGLVKKIHAKV